MTYFDKIYDPICLGNTILFLLLLHIVFILSLYSRRRCYFNSFTIFNFTVFDDLIFPILYYNINYNCTLDIFFTSVVGLGRLFRSCRRVILITHINTLLARHPYSYHPAPRWSLLYTAVLSNVPAPLKHTVHTRTRSRSRRMQYTTTHMRNNNNLSVGGTHGILMFCFCQLLGELKMGITYIIII